MIKRTLLLLLILVSDPFATSREVVSEEIEEISRARSPDGIVEAILTKSNFGATVDYVYKLYIVPTGATALPDEPIVVADHVVDPNIAWRMPKFLTFSYGKARIFNFTNFWQSKDVQNFSYVVEIRLIPTSDSYSLDTQ